MNNLPAAPIVQLLSEWLPQPLIHEVSADLTYKGYYIPNTGFGEDQPKCLILKIEKDGSDVTTTKYSNGELTYDKIWDDREDLAMTYSYL